MFGVLAAHPEGATEVELVDEVASEDLEIVFLIANL